MAADTERGADEETVLVGKLDGAHISIRLDGLRVALAAQGLHVVTDTEASELAELRERVAKAQQRASSITDYSSTESCLSDVLEALRGK